MKFKKTTRGLKQSFGRSLLYNKGRTKSKPRTSDTAKRTPAAEKKSKRLKKETFQTTSFIQSSIFGFKKIVFFPRFSNGESLTTVHRKRQALKELIAKARPLMVSCTSGLGVLTISHLDGHPEVGSVS